MKNQVLITIDSLRYDVFEAADLPFLKSHEHTKAYTHGTYTLPAHDAFFTGKLPCTYSGTFDTVARSYRQTDGVPQWRLMNPESDGPAKYKLEGRNIIHGFKNLGYHTIGTGAVGWFNRQKPAHIPAIDDFNAFGWFGEFVVAKEQIEFCLKQILKHGSPYFAFINFGETHHTFRINEQDQGTGYGDFDQCFKAQTRCIEYLDDIIENFIKKISEADIIICSDHGECFGEDGLWGHSFFHEKIIEVPIIRI